MRITELELGRAMTHAGVKGMKWHTKKGTAPEIVQPAVPTPAHSVAAKHAIADHNVAVTKTNVALEAIHQKYAAQLKGIAASSPSKQKAYTEAKQAYLDNLHHASDKPKPSTPGVPAGKTPLKKYGIVERNNGSWGVHLVKPMMHGIISTDNSLAPSAHDILYTVMPERKHGVPSKMYPLQTIMRHADEEDENDTLEHHGVKGMKWGVRRDRSGGGGAVSKSKGGGPVHADAKRANDAHATTKTHGTAALGDQELKKLVERMNMEQQFSRLNASNTGSGRAKKGREFVKNLVDAGNTVNSAIQFANSPAGKVLKKTLAG